MPFAHAEYDLVFAQFMNTAMRSLAVARNDLLRMVGFTSVQGPLTTRLRDRDGLDVTLEPGRTNTTVTTDIVAVIAGDLDVLVVALDESADELADQLVKIMLGSLDEVIDGTGNSFDSGGRPLTPDLMADALEKMELSVDAEGELILPTLIVHPDQAKTLAELPPPTPQQQQRLNEVLERKREEARARRRHRRLS